MTHRWFWPLILVASLLLTPLVLVVAVIAWAFLSDTTFGVYADPVLLVVMVALSATGLALLVVAARVR
ncbi:MAG: hypothetical protein ACR2G9_08880 [Gaiellaceae bacterium]